jgi:hypothetical protein
MLSETLFYGETGLGSDLDNVAGSGSNFLTMADNLPDPLSALPGYSDRHLVDTKLTGKRRLPLNVL